MFFIHQLHLHLLVWDIGRTTRVEGTMESFSKTTKISYIIFFFYKSKLLSSHLHVTLKVSSDFDTKWTIFSQYKCIICCYISFWSTIDPKIYLTKYLLLKQLWEDPQEGKPFLLPKAFSFLSKPPREKMIFVHLDISRLITFCKHSAPHSCTAQQSF